MLSTIGAIILSYQATFAVYANKLDIPVASVEQATSISYQQNPVLVAIVDHYNSNGPWAGTFKIDKVLKFRIEKVTENKSIAHVKYNYAAIPNNPKGRTDTGIDQRTFTFIKNDDGIKVIEMGAFNSTKL